MGALRKTMEYLGLSEPDVDHELDYVTDTEESYEMADVEDLPLAREVSSHRAPVTPISSARSAAPGDLRRIATVHPRTYNDAKVIGESFRSGTPVIMNLTEMSDAEAKRLVDFSAGLAFGLHGTIERVTAKVFLLSPASIEIQAEGLSSGAQSGSGLFNQS
ncbi:cell division inhibitor SepF [Salana multivorans]|uniref:Cell division protein SepF n=1 Tax=Salana multivorans TaxID=120377 RepID=A0A3N2D244_9MICO|nr:cell division protein SepF [Salana multivorans]MBN8882568.1 cell division protein SepF [Salana multivorans]OJX95603.1 MAG: cell division protein SepF [Micrococcales bacterium 73-15]ROR93837.1 cell division inhibitor SepF [Salana multivorans]